MESLPDRFCCLQAGSFVKKKYYGRSRMHISYGEKGITSLKKHMKTQQIYLERKNFWEVDFCRFMDNDEPFSNKQAVVPEYPQGKTNRRIRLYNPICPFG